VDTIVASDIKSQSTCLGKFLHLCRVKYSIKAMSTVTDYLVMNSVIIDYIIFIIKLAN
jgi:hypothetical protein